jgi:2-hydroxychromene-2-carboxylate isomerase
MGLRDRLRGAAINAYLGDGMRTLRRDWHKLARRGRREITFFHQVDDPHSHLLAQLLQRMLEPLPLQLRVVVVPAPAAELDAEPQLRARYGLRDARELSSRHALSLPGTTAPPPTLVHHANAILLQDRGGREQLALAVEVGEALWACDEAELRALQAKHGDVADVGAALTLNGARLNRAGHYQGAMLRYEGEWYWGPDRLHYLEQRLRLEGFDVPHALADGLGIFEGPLEAEDVGAPLEMYFSFRSPYSYLALDRAVKLSRTYGVELIIKPVLPMVMRGFSVPLNKRLYIVRDAAREARRLGVPFGRICDPLGIGIKRCLAIFANAAAKGHAHAFTTSAARGIWAEALDVSSDEDLSTIVRRAGLDWTEAAGWLDDDSWVEQAEHNRLELLALGLWGVPSFRFGDQVVWGQDRLDRIEERLR